MTAVVALFVLDVLLLIATQISTASMSPSEEPVTLPDESSREEIVTPPELVVVSDAFRYVNTGSDEELTTFTPMTRVLVESQAPYVTVLPLTAIPQGKTGTILLSGDGASGTAFEVAQPCRGRVKILALRYAFGTYDLARLPQ